jgi:hypothetical protein
MRRFMLLGLAALTAGLATGCTEDLFAPGVGACPAFCPPEQVAVVDTTLLDAVVNDSAYRGYVLPQEAGAMQLVADPGGALPASRVIAQFLPFAERLLLRAGDTTTGAILATDSFDIRVSVQARGGAGLELAFYRLPATADTSTTFAALDPYFADSTRLAIVAIPDTVTADTVSARFAADAFPTLDADGRVAAVGVELRAVDRGFVSLGSLEGADGPILTRHVQLDSAGVSVPRVEGKLPAVDTFVAPNVPPSSPDLLRIGGAPSARSLLRFTIPPRILDSSTVVRATLILVPAAPAVGAPGDTLHVLAQGVTVDVGAKSPLIAVLQDSVLAKRVQVLVGSADTVRLDLTTLVLAWAADSTRPRSVMVRAVPEGGAFAESLFGSSASPANRPALQITFVPPLNLGGR